MGRKKKEAPEGSEELKPGETVSLKECYKLAVGVLGIDPEYYLHTMSMEAFNLALQGYTEESRAAWYQARTISYWASVAHLKDQKYSNFCRMIMPFAWEDSKPRMKPTAQQTERYMEILKNVIDGQK